MNPVFITGFDQVSSMGRSLEALDHALWNGVASAEMYEPTLEGLDPIHTAVCRAPLNTSKLISPSKVPMDRGTALALMMAIGACSSASLHLSEIDAERLGVFWGAGMAGAYTFDQTARALYVKHQRIRPTNVVSIMPNAPAAEIALWSRAKSLCQTYANACASSATAIGEALHAIRSRRLDVAIVGGSEAMISPAVIASWHAMRVLAQLGDQPQRACKPFDSKRSGFILGEGAAALVLESEEHAAKRGAKPLALLSGYGATSDGFHITNPDPAGQVRAMRMALQDAGLKSTDIHYVNAHGTGTKAGDLAEALSITEVFDDYRVPVSSTKGLHGHVLGAGGALELVVCLRALQNNKCPVSANLEDFDPDIKLNLVQKNSVFSHPIRHAMSNSFAFGGTNAVLVVSAP